MVLSRLRTLTVWSLVLRPCSHGSLTGSGEESGASWNDEQAIEATALNAALR